MTVGLMWWFRAWRPLSLFFSPAFRQNCDSCHLQKFTGHAAIVGRVSEGSEPKYREVFTDFVSWYNLNYFQHLSTPARQKSYWAPYLSQPDNAKFESMLLCSMFFTITEHLSWKDMKFNGLLKGTRNILNLLCQELCRNRPVWESQ